MVENPFDRYDLDAWEGIEAITQHLKERAEDATSEVERANLRAAWEALTFHPAERLRSALFAYPETRASLGMPPSSARVSIDDVWRDVQFRDTAARPSARLALGEADAHLDDVPSLDDDPLL